MMQSSDANGPRRKDGEKSWSVFFQTDTDLGHKFQLEEMALGSKKGASVGRKSDANDIVIEDSAISRSHCRFSLDADGNLVITDLGSKNGTFVNEAKLSHNKATAIGPADSVRIADLQLEITFPPDAVDDGAMAKGDGTIMMDAPAEFRPPPSDMPDAAAEGHDVPIHNNFIEAVMTFGARRRALSAMMVLVITTIAVFGALKVQIDTSYDSLFSANDPGYVPYTKVIKEFGSDNISLIYLTDDELFTPKRLAIIEELTFALQDLDFVEKSESLFTALNIRDNDGSLDLNPLMDTLPESVEEIAVVKDNALYSPLIRRNFLSEDGKTTAISVTVINVAGDPTYNRRVFDTFEKLIAPHRKDFGRLFQVGPPRLNVEIETGILSDMALLSPLSTIILVACIVFFLHTYVAALLPLTTAGLSILWTLGFMGFAGIPLNLLTAILPSLVIVIGSTEDTHMLSAYLHGLQTGEKPDRKLAIRFMAVHVGLPILITSFTTTVGFLTNAISDITLIKHFGFASSFSMAANLVVTILVLPLLLSIVGPKESKISTETGEVKGFSAVLLNFLENLSDKHEKKIAALILLFVVVFSYMSLTVTASNDPLSYFKSGNEIINHSQALHDDLAGMQVFYLTIDAEKGTDFKDPEQLRRVAQVEAFMRNQGAYDKIVSIIDYLVLVNREMNLGRQEFYRLPDKRNLVEQYLLLFQRSDIERYLNPSATKANILVRHNMSDSAVLNRYFDELNVELEKVLGARNDFRMTGKNLMINRAAETMFESQVTSLGLLIAIIFVIMTLLYTSITAGLLSLVPNLIPVVAMFGTMGILGIPLNPGTAIVAVIAVGIAIDDTIHLLSTYNAECKLDPDQVAATQRTIRHEAIPVISTSIALAAGFLILYFSRFNIVAQFGLLSALTMIVAMFSDLLVTPILLKRIRLVGIWDILSMRVGKEVLLKNNLFVGMSSFQVRKTILLSEMKEFSPGDIIIRQGDAGRDMYLIISGIAEILHFDGKHKKLLAKCGWGEVFGESGYVGGSHRMATVRAGGDEPLRLLLLNEKTVSTAMRFYPRISSKLNRNINRILARRLIDAGGSFVHKA